MIERIIEWVLIAAYWIVVTILVNKNSEKHISNPTFLFVALMVFFTLVLFFGYFENTQDEAWWEF